MTADAAQTSQSAATSGLMGNQATTSGATVNYNNTAQSMESSSSIQNQLVQELNQKLIESSNQCNSLRVELQMTKQTLEQSQKENAELKAQLNQKDLYSGKQATDSQEVKRLQDEINRLTSLTKNRD